MNNALREFTKNRDDIIPFPAIETLKVCENRATLNARTVKLALLKLELKQEITRRKTVEKHSKKREHHYSQLLKQAKRLQDHSRQLSHKILSAHEDERKRISRDLHDVIAQALTAISIRLAALKTEATVNPKNLQEKITSTQRLVEESVNIVHRFARELRPMMLDDLGLIPALHAFMQRFSSQTGIRTRLTAFAGLEPLTPIQRTVLFRVAQEALTNVSRHACAREVQVMIKKLNGVINMSIDDNGKGFHAKRVLHTPKNRRLGLLGMKERLEM